MKKINFTEIKDKAIKVFNTTGRVVIVAAALFIGFTAGEIYRSYKKGLEINHMPQVQKIESTSIAINDRGELMVIDRQTGKYLLFQDSVGQQIFNQYASRIYVQKQSVGK